MLKKKLIKIITISLILIPSFYFLDFFVEQKTHKFTTRGIASRLPFNSDWSIPTPSQEELQNIKTLFKQKFTYLNSGGQSFAFLSEDGQYVLKFFKLYRRRLPDGLMYLPLPSFLDKIRDKKVAVKQAKLKRDFDSYMLAYHELREQSALLFLHLNKTNFLHQKVTIIDKIGIEHQIALDETEFLLQKRVTLVYEAINDLMAKGELEVAKKRIDSLLKLILIRYKKGIYDDDAVVSKNYGFDGENPILLDIGRFQKKPEYTSFEVYIRDLEVITARFRLWLEQSHPSLAPYLDEAIGQIGYTHSLI